MGVQSNSKDTIERTLKTSDKMFQPEDLGDASQKAKNVAHANAPLYHDVALDKMSIDSTFGSVETDANKLAGGEKHSSKSPMPSTSTELPVESRTVSEIDDDGKNQSPYGMQPVSHEVKSSDSFDAVLSDARDVTTTFTINELIAMDASLPNSGDEGSAEAVAAGDEDSCDSLWATDDKCNKIQSENDERDHDSVSNNNNTTTTTTSNGAENDNYDDYTMDNDNLFGSAALGTARLNNIHDLEHEDNNTHEVAEDDLSVNQAPILALPPPPPASPDLDNVITENGTSLKISADHDRRGRIGLGNLGNTCFMNSTLQCLAHIDILREYFLSNQYLKDLNKKNQLGTGGEMATEFANLLKQMWDDKSAVKSGNGYDSTAYRYSGYSSNTVYPRSFKFALGRHAEQFMGYDQHDSQELATYLLDALHEDTNLVTQKPYVEKPEQEENEHDLDAARKAWDAHTRRENSFINKTFVGQVKSKVTCPVQGCGRVSTTYDPFMYLSVPIPGTTEVTIPVTFVHLDPLRRFQKLSVTTPKSASIATLLGQVSDMTGTESEDLYIADIWKSNVHLVLQSTDPVSNIKEIDDIHIYQLEPKESIRRRHIEIDKVRALSSVGQNKSSDRDFTDHGLPGCEMDRHELPEAIRLKYDDITAWIDVICDHSSQMMFNRLTNTKRSKHEERLDFLAKLDSYLKIEKMRLCSTNENILSNRQSGEIKFPMGVFHGVQTIEDALILEYCGQKFRQWTDNVYLERLEDFKDGVIVTALISGEVKLSAGTPRETCIATPIIMRIPCNLTVRELRCELATRLSRSLHFPHCDINTKMPAVSTSGTINGELPMSEDECDTSNLVETDETTTLTGLTKKSKLCTDSNSSNDDMMLDEQEEHPPRCDALKVMERVPLTFQNESNGKAHKLGSIDLEQVLNARNEIVADPFDDAERVVLAEMLGQGRGKIIVTMQFCTPRLSACLDPRELQAVEGSKSSNSSDKPEKKSINVLDCIEKYCYKEQLEESEMWYCNRCKTHVQAWKHIHIFQAPPILIIQLKRFTFSPTTHRRNKISLHVDFPLEGLDLTSYVLHWDEGQDPIYDCFAVSNHYGGLGGGHYTAYALNHGKWCYFDDSSVTENVSTNEVVSSAAYVLYYRRRDVKVPDSEIEDMTMEDQEETELKGKLPVAMVLDEETVPWKQPNTAVPFGSPAGNLATDDELSDHEEAVDVDLNRTWESSSAENHHIV